MPAIRAATITLLRAEAQKSPGYSSSGSKLVSTRAPWDSEKSPTPKISASSRGLAVAISSALASPSTSSMSTSRRIGRDRPSLASSWVSSTSTHQTSRPRNAFGTMIVSRFSRAWLTTSTMSSWHHGVSSPLMRIARTVRPQSSSFSAAMALARAVSLCAGATASSRSRNTRSASEAAAWANMWSLLAGTASSERRSKDVIGVFLSQHTAGLQFVGVAAGKAEQFAVHLGVVLTDPGTKMLDSTGRRREPRHRRLDCHGTEFVVADFDEDFAMRQLFVRDEVGDVVDRRGGHFGGVENLHRLGQRLGGPPVGDHLADLGGPRQPPLRVGEVGVVDQVGASDGPKHPQRQLR